MRTPGRSSERNFSIAAMDRTRLCTKKTCPPRRSSCSTASFTAAGSNFSTKVRMARRSSGGVAMMERSRTPARLMWSVRGMGVAVRVSTSTSLRSFFRRSLWATPKRCSSSTTRSPRSRKETSLASSRWVPTRTSTFPAAASARTLRTSSGVFMRETASMRTG